MTFLADWASLSSVEATIIFFAMSKAALISDLHCLRLLLCLTIIPGCCPEPDVAAATITDWHTRHRAIVIRTRPLNI
jgi:hypothetical protein